MEGVVVLVQTDPAIGRFGRGNHGAEDSTGADVHCFLNEGDDLSVHVVREAVFDDEDSQRPAEQVGPSDYS